MNKRKINKLKKKKRIIVIIILIIVISFITILITINNNNNKTNKSKTINSSFFNSNLDVEITHEDKYIKINDFTETPEFYLFNLTNNSNKDLNFELLEIEFLDKNKNLITTEKFSITIETKYIRTIQVRKSHDVQNKVKYIKLINKK